MTTPTLDQETILQTIRVWPTNKQLALAQAITRQVDQAMESRRASLPQRPSWRELAGIGRASNQTAPTDEQVARWLDERRQEKYGS